MIFTKSRSITTSNKNPENVVMVINPKKMSMNLTNIRQSVVVNQPQTQNQVVSSNDNQPDMTWGAPIWCFFHTFAEKIKDSEFDGIKGELFEIIVKICNNLPCPECTRHASEYMNTVNFNKITCKKELKLMLYTFHNTVNKRKNYKEFPLMELDEKYASENTIDVFNKFAINLEYKRRYVHLMIGEQQRKQIVKKIKQWLIDNLHIFDK
jgi:excinuclease UvrABC ATPase subunit